MSLALANLVLATFMAGVGWIVQVVHYPLFADVGRSGWGRYHSLHSRRITWVVAGPMLASPAVAGALLVTRPDALTAANLALAAGLLAVTATAFGRLHARLDPWDDAAHARLLHANAARVAAWTAQVGLALAIAAGS